MSDESVNVTSELQPCVSVTTGSGESVSATSEAPCCVGVTNQGPQGEQGTTGLIGPTGAQGITGPEGSAGAAAWTTSSTVPDNEEGNNGDFHFEHDSNIIWYKVGGQWSLLANITGPQGSQGPAGEDGEDAVPLPMGFKHATSTGSIGERSFGFDTSNSTWYLFVCYATNQWARTEFETNWT